jgi:sRNA-binding carbon storage regulator CsrA
MLVLTRKKDERVVVLDADTNVEVIAVQVLDVAEGRVKSGFENPPLGAKMPIHRQEHYDQRVGKAQALPSDAATHEASGGRCLDGVRERLHRPSAYLDGFRNAMPK